MTKVDRAALKLAVDRCLADPVRTAQIKAKLRDESWEDVARFCASCCQGESLGLRPWQDAPCWIVDPDNPDVGRTHPGAADIDDRHEAARLLRRMLAAGVSKWHPDPLAAIAAAAANRGNPDGR